MVRSTAACTKRHKTKMKLFSSFLLIMVPWMSVSKAAKEMSLLSGAEVVGCFAIGIAMHCVYLAFNYTVAHYVMRFPLAEKKAVVILTSQKTLPVALSVISFLPEGLGVQGIMALPCILSHFCQIVMDGFIAAKWATYVDEEEELTTIPFERFRSASEV